MTPIQRKICSLAGQSGLRGDGIKLRDAGDELGYGVMCVNGKHIIAGARAGRDGEVGELRDGSRYQGSLVERCQYRLEIERRQYFLSW